MPVGRGQHLAARCPSLCKLLQLPLVAHHAAIHMFQLHSATAQRHIMMIMLIHLLLSLGDTGNCLHGSDHCAATCMTPVPVHSGDTAHLIHVVAPSMADLMVSTDVPASYLDETLKPVMQQHVRFLSILWVFRLSAKAGIDRLHLNCTFAMRRYASICQHRANRTSGVPCLSLGCSCDHTNHAANTLVVTLIAGRGSKGIHREELLTTLEGLRVQGVVYIWLPSQLPCWLQSRNNVHHQLAAGSPTLHGTLSADRRCRCVVPIEGANVFLLGGSFVCLHDTTDRGRPGPHRSQSRRRAAV